MEKHREKQAAKLIFAMAIKLQLNDGIKTAIVHRANELFKNSDKKPGQSWGGPRKVEKTRMSVATAALCLYIACRKEGLPMTLNKIIAVSTVSEKEICKSFNLVLNGDEAYWFCDVLSLSKKVEAAATFITRKTRNLGIVSEGASNVVVALAAIYMASQASDDKRTKKEISDITGFHTMTIRKNYKLMRPRAAELFPRDFRFFTPIENLPKT